MRYLFIFFLLINFCFSANLQRNDSLGVVVDKENRLMWVDEVSILKQKMTHQDATDFCEELQFAGYSNWRVPEIEEYELIVDKTNERSYINRAFKYNKKDGFWARKAHWRTLWFYADYMYFVSGTSYYDSRHKLKYVRCVRDLD
jgi:hypothetical protein